MHKLVRIGLAGTLAAVIAVPASAQSDVEGSIRERLGKMLPEYQISSIHETPVPGVYEVVLGSDLVYVSADGRYMMQGRLIDLEKRENLSETSPRLAEVQKQQAKERMETLAKIGDDQTVVFAPERYDHTINVFTDIDCGYCRKLHREIEDYEAEGIRVRYLFYPRAGKGSPSFQKAVSVWCADDRQAAMTEAKAGKNVPKKDCANPVQEHIELGNRFGISGTPAIVLDNGEMVPGYVPPKRLAAVLKASGN
jgi:thiol:disulfide interchange protein DsbC